MDERETNDVVEIEGENNDPGETQPCNLSAPSDDHLDENLIIDQISPAATLKDSSSKKSPSQPGTSKQSDEQETNPPEEFPKLKHLLSQPPLNEKKYINPDENNKILRSLLEKQTSVIPMPSHISMLEYTSTFQAQPLTPSLGVPSGRTSQPQIINVPPPLGLGSPRKKIVQSQDQNPVLEKVIKDSPVEKSASVRGKSEKECPRNTQDYVCDPSGDFESMVNLQRFSRTSDLPENEEIRQGSVTKSPNKPVLPESPSKKLKGNPGESSKSIAIESSPEVQPSTSKECILHFKRIKNPEFSVYYAEAENLSAAESNLSADRGCPSENLSTEFEVLKSTRELKNLQTQLNNYNISLPPSLVEAFRDFLFRRENAEFQQIFRLEEIYHGALQKLIGVGNTTRYSDTTINETIKYLEEAAKAEDDPNCNEILEKLSIADLETKLQDLYHSSKYCTMHLAITAYNLVRWHTEERLQPDYIKFRGLQSQVEELYKGIETIRRTTARLLTSRRMSIWGRKIELRHVTFLMAMATVSSCVYNFLEERNNYFKNVLKKDLE